MAARSDLLQGAPPPTTWDEVVALSKASGKVALSLAGPHAVLSYLSIAAALGEPPAERDPDLLVSPDMGRRVYEILVELAMLGPQSVRAKNPIGILGHMAGNDDVALCPLVYGYVNYAAPDSGRPLRFSNAPRAVAGGRPGSTLGGTGIGISRRCAVTPELTRHLRVADERRRRRAEFIPAHDGQPSRRSAWADASVNARWGDFYRNTSDTLEARLCAAAPFAATSPSRARHRRCCARPSSRAGPPRPWSKTCRSLYRASRRNGGER